MTVNLEHLFLLYDLYFRLKLRLFVFLNFVGVDLEDCLVVDSSDADSMDLSDFDFGVVVPSSVEGSAMES